MPRWIIDAPKTLEFDGVAALRVRVISGTVAVLASDTAPAVDVASLAGQPLLVSHEAGILTITYEDLSWDGLLGWLRPQRHSAEVTVTVPRGCPTQLGVVNASAIVSGISANISVKSVSGDITLDGVTGKVDAKTVSGDLEARGLDGAVTFNSVSGDLTLAGGSVQELDAKTVSGKVTADVVLRADGGLRVTTVSGEVAVRLPADTSAEVDFRSTSGRVRTGFEGLLCARSPGSNTVAGTLGAGSGRLTVTTLSAPVTLLQRGQPPCPQETAGDA
jgi:Putative adhesin